VTLTLDVQSVQSTRWNTTLFWGMCCLHGPEFSYVLSCSCLQDPSCLSFIGGDGGQSRRCATTTGCEARRLLQHYFPIRILSTYPEWMKTRLLLRDEGTNAHLAISMTYRWSCWRPA
jgi:hypothetical protein